MVCNGNWITSVTRSELQRLRAVVAGKASVSSSPAFYSVPVLAGCPPWLYLSTTWPTQTWLPKAASWALRTSPARPWLAPELGFDLQYSTCLTSNHKCEKQTTGKDQVVPWGPSVAIFKRRAGLHEILEGEFQSNFFFF